ncbi:hypothetical protein AB0L82_35650 [Nocardia sp. NPDC052001]|uniref:hypothetical protein n=1 Tax=Nocardia sp. NPDC052001 TaxID=3154853 RepID=UPI0034262F96
MQQLTPFRSRLRRISATLAVGISLTATVLTAGTATANLPDCSSLQHRIDIHNTAVGNYEREIKALNKTGNAPDWQIRRYDAWKTRLNQEKTALDAEQEQCKPRTSQEYASQAYRLGYTQRIPPQKAPFDSHGESVYSNGTRYITPDNTGHKVTDGWKMFDRKGSRIGTYTWDLSTKVGK